MTAAPGNTAGPRMAHPAHRAVILTLCALVVGALASLAAIGLTDAVLWLNDRLLIAPRARVQYEASRVVMALATVLVPAAGGLIVALILRYLSRARRPLGPPDVIEAVQFERAMPPLRDGLASTLAAMVSLGFGASVGQYGPMVYLGAMLGGTVRRLGLAVPNLPAIAVACGVAAAISTAFNAPIAGLVFAHEVVLRHYSTQAFAPTTVAAATGYVFANVIFERPALFLLQFDGVRHGHEFVLFAILGLLCAVLAILFMRLILRIAAHAAASPIPALLRPMVAGLAVGLTALWLPDVLGIGKEALRFATIEGAFGAGELAILVLAKLVLTALCIGFGFVGGVFSPALLIGILFGALFWTALDASALLATSGVAVYAICGMMALTSPVIGAPLTTILIVFELTRNYDITIAAMVAVVFSNLISHRFFGRSLFDVQMARRGADLSAGRERARLQAMPVTDCLTRGMVLAGTGEAIGAVRARLAASDWNEAYIRDDAGRFAGVLRAADAAADWDSALHKPALTFDDTTTVLEAMQALRGFVGDAIPVIERDSGRLIGVVSEAAVIEAYLDMSQTLRREENAVL
ncbi:MAG: chloride channel protein [Pseudomonadota bacterium]|uniref:chloride channel protein n=2 Tax=Roseovarius TaxID=74030 RepID=UPI0022A8C714|nr:chloride channel protein [Roseovarius sp. EGI FJ00037]MCZ0813713.1 chloride channel protein [Roseovarius sp. EGI FJ00037]